MDARVEELRAQARGTSGPERGLVLLELGMTLLDAERFAEARAALGRARRTLDDPGPAAVCDLHVGRALAESGRTAEALEHLGRAKRAFAQHGRDLESALCQREVARAVLGAGGEPAPVTGPAQVLAKAGAWSEVAECELVMAEQSLAADLHLPALRAAELALDRFLDLGHTTGAARARVVVSEILGEMGRREEALHEALTAREVLERAGLALSVARGDVVIGWALAGLGERAQGLGRALLAARFVLDEAARFDRLGNLRDLANLEGPAEAEAWKRRRWNVLGVAQALAEELGDARLAHDLVRVVFGTHPLSPHHAAYAAQVAAAAARGAPVSLGQAHSGSTELSLWGE